MFVSVPTSVHVPTSVANPQHWGQARRQDFAAGAARKTQGGHIS